MIHFVEKWIAKKPLIAFSSYYLLMCIVAIKGVGWLQADEHFRVLEPAHQIVYGYSTLPWEFNLHFPIVSWFLGLIYAVPLYFIKNFHLSGLTEASLLRCFTALICMTRLPAMWLIFRQLRPSGANISRWILVYAFCPFVPMLFVRSNQENWSATALIWALLFALKSAQKAHYAIFSGIFIALTFCFRFQVGFSAAGLGIYLLFNRPLKTTFFAVIGVFIGLLPMAITDFYAHGTPFLPAFNYLKYALGGEEDGKIWGTDSWTFYAGNYFSNWFPPYSPVLFLALIFGLMNSGILSSIVLPFVVVHFAIAHKEVRYFSPMVPFFILLMFVGWPKFEDWLSKYKFGKNSLIWHSKNVNILFFSAIFVAIFVGIQKQNDAPLMFSEVGQKLRLKTIDAQTMYVADSRNQMSQFYFKNQNMELNKVSIAEMFSLLDSRRSERYTFAVYRINLADFERLKSQCTVHFVSVSPIIMKAMTIFENIPRKKRVDTIVECF